MTNQESTITVRHIYTDGAAPNNQNGCTLGGIGIAVLSPTNELISELSEAVYPKQTIRQRMYGVKCLL